jgi:hypothetical protein
MSENSKKWKPRLLSSSLPLEFDVSKILSKYSFYISHDYSYFRKEDNLHKEFSVDINAKGFVGVRKIKADIAILAECKYREEGKRWVFLPEIGTDFSTFTLGYTLRHENSFSLQNIKGSSIYEFEQNFDCSVKGTEISVSTGEVFDKDIRHGISQLKYALPYIIKDNIEFNCNGNIEDAHPFYIIPVLVTNADLYLFNEDVSIETIKQTEDIETLMKKVPYLVLHNGIGPDFREHHKNIFKDFNKNLDAANIELFEKKQKEYTNEHNMHESAVEECQDLENSDSFTLNKYYTQFFVCSQNHLDDFIKGAMKAIKGSIKKNDSR